MSDTTTGPSEVLVSRGGCHCGAVRFEVTIRRRAISDCNCSMCRKKAPLHLVVPESDFVLLSGSDALTTYTFNTHVAKHLFCSRCGIHAFGRPRSRPDGYTVNVRCLDEDLEGLFEKTQFDGQSWEHTMAARRVAEG